MPAVFSTLLFCPFGRYRHGCDPPASLPLMSSHPSAFNCDQSSFARPSDFLTFSLTSQQLSGFEPFVQPFRHTSIHQRFLEPPDPGFRKEGKR